MTIMTPHAVEWIYICAPPRIPLHKARVSGATLPKASLAVSMVNFHDYSVIAQDTRAYDTVFRLSLARLKIPLKSTFDSGGRKAMAHYGRPLYVSLSGRFWPCVQIIPQLNSLHLAGNSSQPWSMN
jgi:hypothetical protein